ncbi:taurine catabolism dioxygenase [Fragilaria crotonensis]|nr:taurine catabolism dioxygenase [Fragilaria crotonensis]
MTAIPQRFDVLEVGYQDEASLSLQTNGAIILTNIFPATGQTWKDRAIDIPSLLLSPAKFLLSNHQAAGVHVEHDGLSGLKGKPLLPHSDGYVWGDYYPDVVILLCEQQSQGGESYLVDGERVVARLDEKTVDLLQSAKVDHTERGDTGMACGAESVVPVLRWLDVKQSSGSWWSIGQKRLCWRRMVSVDAVFGRKPVDEDSYISLWKSLDDEAVDAALLSLDQAILKEDSLADRFQLQRGEALIIDNFRMLHAREGYNDAALNLELPQDRRMWRVWSWTEESNGLPPNVKDDEMPANLADAEKAIASTLVH